jgi:hypothetical protein
MLRDGILAAHQSTDMNGQRFLFRLWLIASGLWICAWAFYLWRTCARFGQDRWCRTDYSSRLSELSTGSFLEMVAWGAVAPLTVLVLGVVTYQVIKHFRQH